MNTFPKIDYIQSFNKIPTKIAHKQVSSAGYIMSAPASTVKKNKISITYEKVSLADVALVDAFFDANQGSAFYLFIPLESNSYTVVFDIDEITWNYTNTDFNEASCTIDFREV